MRSNKGFTLIELLVVIAIIGILSSVVLASLNTARAKGADAAIKGNINGIRAQAELYYDSNGNKYATGDVTACTKTSGSIFFDTNINNAINAAVAQSSAATCVASTTSWAVSVPLKSDPAISFCIDGYGNATTTAESSVDDVTELQDAKGCL